MGRRRFMDPLAQNFYFFGENREAQEAAELGPGFCSQGIFQQCHSDLLYMRLSN